jgi:hypothetical protein
MAQGILLVDPNVLHKIVERVLQELLQAEDASYQGGHTEPARTPGQGRNLLQQALCSLPKKREGAPFGPDGGG